MSEIAQRNKDFFYEKLFSFGVSIGFILALSPLGVESAYLILGHSHFMITAWYQYKRGRITLKKAAIYFVTLLLLFKIAHTYPGFFTVFTSGFLIIHVLSGEIRHFNRLYLLPYSLLTFSLMTLLCAWLSIEIWGWSIDIFPLTVFLNFLVVVSAVSYFSSIPLRQVDACYATFLVVYLVFLAMEYMGQRMSSYESFGFIVIAHYMTTYFNVTKKFKSIRLGMAKIFVLESLSINTVFLVGFITVHYWIGTSNLLYDTFYHPISFYVWTVMHFLTTWNNDEFKHVLKPVRVDGVKDA